MRSLSCSQSPRYVNTLSRHSRLNSATPSFSISCLPLMPSCFSTSISTGRPCVSHPALRVHAVALHRAMAAEEVLDRAREHVVDARRAVRRRRTLEEHERLGAPARASSVRSKRSSSRQRASSSCSSSSAGWSAGSGRESLRHVADASQSLQHAAHERGQTRLRAAGDGDDRLQRSPARARRAGTGR